MIVFGTLLPFATKMTTKLHHKKLAMYAAETAYHAAIAYNAYGEISGKRSVEQIDYTWDTGLSSICVAYQPEAEVLTKCFSY